MTRSGWAASRALFADFRQQAGRCFPQALLLIVAGAFAEGFGILLLVPILAAAGGSDAASLGGFATWLPGSSSDARFAIAIALFVAMMVARALLLSRRDRLLAVIEADYAASLKLRAVATLAARGWPHASRIGQAGMQSLLLSEVPRTALAILHGQTILVSLIMLSLQCVLAALLSPALALSAAAIILVGLAGSRGWLRRGEHSGFAISDGQTASAQAGFRLHGGLKTALAQGALAQYLIEYRSSLANLSRDFAIYAADLARVRTAASVAAACAAAVLLLIGDRWLALPLPLLITSLVLFARMSAPAQQLQHSLQGLAAHVPSFTAIITLLGPLTDPPPLDDPPLPLDWRRLTLDKLSFRHDAGAGLSDVALTLDSGQWLGIGGASGAGKSTLIDLIVGLLVPHAGHIMVDGAALDRDLSGVRMRRWKAGIAYVGQAESGFDDSLRNNLSWGSRPASDAALWAVLELVGLSERIRASRDGLDSRFGDRANALSGGERQRIAIARGLLRRPSLLILDEATNALDAESERLILTRLRALEPRPAMVIAAHRSESLAQCDQIVNIEGGCVVAAVNPSPTG